jgi:hypothetical protein
MGWLLSLAGLGRNDHRLFRQLAAPDVDLARGRNAQTNPMAVHRYHGDNDIVVDADGFANFSTENEHDAPPEFGVLTAVLEVDVWVGSLAGRSHSLAPSITPCTASR